MTHRLPTSNRKPVASALAGALLALLAAQAPGVEARERGAAAQRPARPVAQRPQPVRPPVTRTTETQRTDTGYVRNTTLTRPDGATATQTRTVVNDRENGLRSIDVSRTGFDGKTRSMSQDTQRTESGWTSSRTLTNAAGETASRNTSVAVDKDAGTRTRETSWTTFDGRNANSTTVTTRTEDGFTRETTGTGPNGQSFERSVTKECDRAAGKCTTTVTHDRGNDAG